MRAYRTRGGRGAARVFGTLAVCAAVVALVGCAKPGQTPDHRIAVLDAQRVLSESAIGKRAKETLEKFAKNRQALIEIEERELRRMEEDFVKQGSVLSASAKREREEVFRRRMTDYQQKAAELNREVQEKQKEVLEGFREQLERVVETISKQMNLQLVVEKGRGSPTIYSESSLDISVRVIEELNKE